MSSGGGRRTRTKLLQVALVLGLILISLATITSLAPGGPLWGNSILPPATTSPPVQMQGQLEVGIIHFPSPCLPPTYHPGLVGCVPDALPRNVTFSAVQQGLQFSERHTLVVPVPGQNTITVGTGNYSITTQNPYFNLTAFANVVQGNTTELIVNLNETVMVPKSTEVLDPDLSGKLGPWGGVSLLIQTNTNLLYKDEPVFLQTSYFPIFSYSCYYFVCSGNMTGPSFETTPATVQLIVGNQAGYWATLSPRLAIDLRNVADTWVVVISTTYQVVMPTSLVVSTVVSSV